MSLEEKEIDVIDPEMGQLNTMVTVNIDEILEERATDKRLVLNIENLQDQIGVQLRAVYETLISEPVPDRFLKLLEELDQRTTKS